MPLIIIATCKTFPELQPSDEIFAEALRAYGADVCAAPWNGCQTAFANADAVIIRSTWDYQQQPKDFLVWLERQEAAAHIFNAPELMRWNLSKQYLLELEKAGAPMAPLRWVEPRADHIAAALDTLGLTTAVVKPEIGATASGISIVHREDRDGIERAAQVMAMPGMVQALIPEITTEGETSFMFAGGEFTHAVTKMPKQGDIRCQAEFGGATTLISPPDWAIAQASKILSMVPGRPLYARIDAVLLDGSMQLMEVELIEPELFFTYCPDGAARLAAALIQRL
ncbi:ATP-grasp domain-containing protein [Hyphococcus sp.]|uniref:ATP-grasp domain-containing protein n=1 Tax=Hyphococcus sp. TaxID=2038636 RepID=UPI003CCBCE8E